MQNKARDMKKVINYIPALVCKIHSLLLHVSNLYTNEYGHSVRENTTLCCPVSYSNKIHNLRSPVTSEMSTVCAAFKTTHSLTTEEVSKMSILKVSGNGTLHTDLPTFWTLYTVQWVKWLKTDLSIEPNSVPPHCNTCGVKQNQFPKRHVLISEYWTIGKVHKPRTPPANM
jgi:hypothetical protein